MENIKKVREEIDSLKSKLKKSKCLYKVYDTLEDCLRDVAENSAEDFKTTPNVLKIALEEVVYDYEHDLDEIEELLNEDKE